MLAEKKSLKRFLFVYISSTLLLIGISEFFYYRAFKSSIIEQEKDFLERQLKLYLSKLKNNQDIFALKKLMELKSFKIDIAIYKNNIFMFGTSMPTYLVTDREYWIDNGKLYLLFIIPSKKGKIYILLSRALDKTELHLFLKKLVILDFFILLFILLVSYYLGKLFISPMKEALSNLNEFVRDATHEMNTPISIILANLDLLNIKKPDLEESVEIKRIKAASERLSKIFKDLSYIKLEFYRPRNIEQLNLSDIIFERLDEFEFFIKNKGISVETEIMDCEVNADKEDIVRLIDNIISNAIKYSPHGSIINITLLNCIFSVVNPGKIRDAGKIQKEFVRENRNEGGFGIGLYIVRKICEYYHYNFWIGSSVNNVVVKIHFK